MKKDEAKAAVMRLMRAECTCGIPGVKEPCFACEMSAGLDVLAQAAANADTLGMLEALAKMGDDIIWRGLQVRCIPETGYFLYFRPVDNLVNLILLSRAEAEALLAGKGEKE